MTEQNQLIEELEANLANLGFKDRKFATDLIEGKWGFRTRGKLSEKQWYWVKKLLQRAQGQDSKQEPDPKFDGHEAGFEFFKQAKTKYPTIVFQMQDDSELRVHMTGSTSKYPGSLSLSANQGYGGPWYGRIAPDGTWHMSKYIRSNEEKRRMIWRLMNHFFADPKTVANEEGIKSGRCVFCNKKLTDTEKSVKLGYGPVCAKNWNMPHTKAAANLAEAATDKPVGELLKEKFSESEDSPVVVPLKKPEGPIHTYSKMSLGGGDHVVVCNDCGAAVMNGTEDQVVHHDTCKPGESEKWEKHYADNS